MADLEWLALIADEKLRVAGDGALMDAKDAELADERIDDHLEHVRKDVLLGVGRRGKFDGCRAFSLSEQGWVALGWVGRELDQDIEQFGHARAGSRGDEAHWHEMPFAQ